MPYLGVTLVCCYPQSQKTSVWDTTIPSEYSISKNIKLNWSSLTFEKMLQMLRHLRPDTHLL